MCTIIAEQDGNLAYNPAPLVARSFVVNDPLKQNQSISFAPLPSRSVGDAPFTLGATASSGLPVGFTATGACSVGGNLVALQGAGDCTVTAHQSGNMVYNVAMDVERSFHIAAQGSASHLLYLPLMEH
jgi:hypothetical protein